MLLRGKLKKGGDEQKQNRGGVLKRENESMVGRHICVKATVKVAVKVANMHAVLSGK